MALALAIAFAAATHDIAIDAYSVEVLRKEEQGAAVGARIAMYRMAMYVAGGLTIFLAAQYSWPMANALLAILVVPILFVTWKAPEPETAPAAPRTLREAVWHPFLGFLTKHRALELLAFVVLYKLGDNLAGALLRPFLFDMGYDAFDRGLAVTTAGVILTVAGTALGGAMTASRGLGPCLWLFGSLQILSNLGYILLTTSGVNRPLMYAAIGFESFTQGTGTGAFSVFLLRLTQKRFSATQYALFSSLFSLPRIVAGPICGYAVDAVGWATFFWIATGAAIPGMVFLQRFAPLGVREPKLDTQAPPRAARPIGTLGLTTVGLAAGALGTIVSGLLFAITIAAKAARSDPDGAFRLGDALRALVQPASATEWIALAGVISVGVCTGLFTAAVRAVRGGAARELGETSAE
jgi:PAT family beta-lactamase induction signal transducer AmpG